MIYPSLASHPQHELAKRQMTGFTGMISVDVGTLERARALVEHTTIFQLAESLGGVESLVCHPPSMTHAPVSPEALAEAGISIFAISTYDTDYLLVRSPDLEDAVAALEERGHQFV